MDFTTRGTVEEAVSTFNVSQRGASIYVHYDFGTLVKKLLGNPWSPDNPNGLIVLGVADNALMHQDVADHFVKNIHCNPLVHLTYGTGPSGSPRLQKALAGFLKSRFHAREDVDPDNIVVMGGVGGINEAFTWSVCNEGEGIIIPRPLYTGFSQVIPARSRGVLIPAAFQDLEGYKSLDDCFDPEMNHKAFEAAYMKATKDGITVKGVVIAHPHNPLGRCYPPETLRVIAKFCNQHKIHLLVDEIYAFSMFENPEIPDALPFTSILALDLEEDIDRSLLHMAYGASKDFCANGLRLGMIYSKNEGLIGSMASVGMFGWPSYIIQDSWASMLEDEKWTTAFLEKNQKLMADNYAATVSFLGKHGIPHYPSNAGQIIWINISKFIFPSVTDSDGLQNLRHLKLGSDDEKKYREREGMVIQRLLQNGVFVAAGSSFFTEEFGWFRLTFTVTGGALEEGLERVRKTLQEVRKDGWAPPAQQTVEQGFKSLPIGIRLPGLSEI